MQKIHINGGKTKKAVYSFIVVCSALIMLMTFTVIAILRTDVIAAEPGSADEYDIKFTREEQDYINSGKKVRVALYGDRNILSSYDKESKVFSGVTYDIMELIRRISGLKIEYSLMPDGMRGKDFFAQDMGKEAVKSGEGAYGSKLRANNRA